MNKQELLASMVDKLPVVCEGIEYPHVNAIIWRASQRGGLIMYAEMQSNAWQSVVTAPAKKIELKVPLQETLLSDFIQKTLIENME